MCYYWSHACHDQLVPKNQINTRVSKNSKQVLLEQEEELQHMNSWTKYHDIHEMVVSV